MVIMNMYAYVIMYMLITKCVFELNAGSIFFPQFKGFMTIHNPGVLIYQWQSFKTRSYQNYPYDNRINNSTRVKTPQLAASLSRPILITYEFRLSCL